MRQRQTILSLQSEVEELKNVNGSLLEEQKEMQVEIERVRTENQKLKAKLMDVSKYIEWEWSDIVSWILNVGDGRFKKYERDLEKALKEEELS